MKWMSERYKDKKESHKKKFEPHLNDISIGFFNE